MRCGSARALGGHKPVDEPSERRHRLNSPGPFFVADSECMACGAPEAQAPDLMAHDDNSDHCYFRKQPTSPDEIDRACLAVLVSCCGAVRYGGDDPAVEGRMSDLSRKFGGASATQSSTKPASTRPWWKFW